MRIALFLPHTTIRGGAKMSTMRLFECFEQGGHEVSILRLSKKTEKFARPFGNTGLVYRNFCLKDLLDFDGQILITNVDKDGSISSHVIKQRPDTVINVRAPGNLKHGRDQYVEHAQDGKVVVIREAQVKIGERYGKKFVFIPHAYEPKFTLEQAMRVAQRRYHAISHCRVEHWKNFHAIFEANDNLPEERRVQVFASEYNRMFCYHSLNDFTPTPYPEGMLGVDLCYESWYDIDLSVLDEDDGKGSQNSTLEALDAGAIPILAKEWGDWCQGFYIENDEQLRKILIDDIDLQRRNDIVSWNCAYLRDTHSYETVCRQYEKVFAS